MRKHITLLSILFVFLLGAMAAPVWHRSVYIGGGPDDSDGGAQIDDTGAIIAESLVLQTTPLAITSGGTGATNAANARDNLGLAIGTNVQAWDAALDDISGLAVTDGNFIVGDGTHWVAESGATARTSLGLGSIATQNANNVAITGGSISGITDLAVADGGTGASDAATARSNLGLAIGTDVQAWDAALDDISGLAVTDGNFVVGDGTHWVAESGATARTSLGLGSIATQNSNDVAITGGSISGITDLAVADGGTGGSDAATARSNLGLGSIATQDSNNVAITGGSISGITDLAIADGGTGSSSAAAACSALGVGTEDSPQFTNLTLSNTTFNSGTVTISGDTARIYIADTTNDVNQNAYLYLQTKNDNNELIGSAGIWGSLADRSDGKEDGTFKVSLIKDGSPSYSELLIRPDYTYITSGVLGIPADTDLLTMAANSLTVAGDVAVNGGDLTSSAATFNLLDSGVTTLNIGGAATTISLGTDVGGTLNAPQYIVAPSGMSFKCTGTFTLDAALGSPDDYTLVDIKNSLGGTAGIQYTGRHISVPSATQTIAAATGVTAAMVNHYETIMIVGDGATDISAKPQIAAGTHGQIITLIGTSAVATVKFDDGDGLNLPTSYTLSLDDTLTLQYITGRGWLRIGSSDN